MAGRLFILRGVADFAPGYFENTAVEAGCIQLSRRAGRYVEDGSYTSPTLTSEGFTALVPSWNADTPKDTSVEMQVRLASEGQWSCWFCFGRWSPYIKRATPATHSDEIAQAEVESLNLLDGVSPATRLQMRILLHTDNPAKSPKLYLLAASTNAQPPQGHAPPAYSRCLPLPSYACQNRDPAISGRMGSVSSLCMMMNRFGCDLLPEEIARTAYDSGAGNYGNMSFLAAVAGMHGFCSYVAHAGMAQLRREVWQGRAVAARVRYRAPALGEENKEQKNPKEDLPPILQGANRDSLGHLVAVHGFVRRGSVEHVLLSDPAAPSDDAVQREIPLATFAGIYTGLALFLMKGPASAGKDGPKRQKARISAKGNMLRLLHQEEELVPAQLEALLPCTICYTLSDGLAYASGAQRQFYYPMPNKEGQLHFEKSVAAGKRMVFYLIGSLGDVWVAERQFSP